ncbi:hypothetical protein YC2023_042398 [Brassica napus]
MGATYRSDAMNSLAIYASERPPRATRRKESWRLVSNHLLNSWSIPNASSELATQKLINRHFPPERLSEYLHSRCFDIPQNWFDNHYTTTFVLGALKTPNIIDPANIQHIVTSNVSNYIRGAEFQEIFEVCGDGIINSDADRASKLKKCYQALLHHQGFQRDSMSITTRKLNEVIASFQSFIRGRNGRGLTRCVPEIHVRHYPSYDNWV